MEIPVRKNPQNKKLKKKVEKAPERPGRSRSEAVLINKETLQRDQKGAYHTGGGNNLKTI